MVSEETFAVLRQFLHAGVPEKAYWSIKSWSTRWIRAKTVSLQVHQEHLSLLAGMCYPLCCPERHAREQCEVGTCLLHHRQKCLRSRWHDQCFPADSPPYTQARMGRSLRWPDAQQRQGRIAYQAELSIGWKSKLNLCLGVIRKQSAVCMMASWVLRRSACGRGPASNACLAQETSALLCSRRSRSRRTSADRELR